MWLRIIRQREEFFWNHVTKSDRCWEYYPRNNHGYGHMFVMKAEGKCVNIGAHRASWMLHHGREIPEGMLICHHCDNPACVRADHLFLGTVKDNSMDASRKGRFWFQRFPNRLKRGADHFRVKMAGTAAVGGVNNGRAKLDDGKVVRIREMHSDGRTIASMAREFDVSESAIRFIVKGKTWKLAGCIDCGNPVHGLEVK